jgi:tetratricopeptide (TPR) repeat protein
MKKIIKIVLKGKILIISGLIFFAGFTLYRLNNSSNNIYEMLRTGGPKTTLSYIMSKDERYKITYEKAWTLYRNLQMSESRNLIYKLMGTDNDKLLADCYYLLGHIAFYEHSYLASIDYFNKANLKYEKLYLHENLFYSWLGISICQIDMRYMDESETSLSNAIMHFKIASQAGVMTLDKSQLKRKEMIGLAQYYLMRKRLELAKGNIKEALMNADNCRIFYNAIGSKNGEANALSDLAYINMILGNVEAGLKYAFEAQHMIVELNDEQKYVHNLLSFLIYFKCNKIPYDTIVKKIEDFYN